MCLSLTCLKGLTSRWWHSNICYASFFLREKCTPAPPPPATQKNPFGLPPSVAPFPSKMQGWVLFLLLIRWGYYGIKYWLISTDPKGKTCIECCLTQTWPWMSHWLPLASVFPFGKGGDWIRTLISFSHYWMVPVLSTLVIGTASPGLSVT